jgi:TonB-linked SusC/RagA family outer membrane protein
MRKTLWLLLCGVLLSLASIAQSQITGRVTDARDGSPLAGVTVSVKNRNITVTTNNDGAFSLSGPANSTLVFSYVGFQTIERAASGVTNVALTRGENALSEVVVTGYGVRSRRDVTGSVGKVTAAQIKDIPIASVDQGLQGRVSGVQITQNSGTPGGGISVRVRGTSSISASAQPLYVVDGVPLITGDFSQLGYGGQSVNALTDLNPADIESMEVLKDASAAAIYGSRAANGVILITTKRGKAQKTQITFNTYTGFQNAWKQPEYLNRTQYMEIFKEAMIDAGWVDKNAPQREVIENWYTPGQIAANPYLLDTTVNTNWIDEVLRTAPISSYELNVAGGDAKTRYYVSGAFFDQKGIVIGSQFRRWSSRLNLDHAASDKLSFGTSIQLSRSVNNRIVSDNTLYGPFANALASAPIFPVRFNGAYTRPNLFYSNPVAEGTENDDDAINLRTFGNAFATYKLRQNIILSAKAGVDLFNLSERRYTPNTYPGNAAASTNGSATSGKSTNMRTFYELTGNWKFDLGQDHKFDFLLGTNTEKNERDVTNVTGIGFPGDKFRLVGSAATVNSGSNSQTANAITSGLTRLYYSYANKFLFDVNFRADYSSRFAPGERWGYFPGVSAAYRLTEEKWLANINWLDELKLRAGYGLLGNQEFGNFSYLNAFGGSNYNDQAGIAPAQLGNKDLTWEKTTQSDIGIDIGLFRSRITITADYYYKKTNDLLFTRPVPAQTGFVSYASNIGNVENKGIDLSLTTVNLTGSNGGVRWTSSLNVSHNKNKVLQLFEKRDIFYGFGGNSLVLREGQPIGTFYGLAYDGVFSSLKDVPAERKALGIVAGDANYRDQNGDKIITDADRVILGNAQPDFTGGLTNTVSFKGFDLNAFLLFSSGNEIWNAAGSFQEGLFGNYFDDNQRATVLSRWRKEGDVTNVPRATFETSVNRNNESNTGRFIEDGSFLRLKNIALGYSLPKRLLGKANISNLRVYAQAQNLFTWTKYKGFDPESNFAGTSNTTLGVDFYTFPQMRQVTFGLNLTF